MFPDKNVAAVLYAKGDLRVEERPKPTPKDDEVLIATKRVGICGSDVEYWTHGAIGHFIVNAPMVIGHESAGVVAQVGANVKDLKVGDRVAMEPGVPCRMCQQCKTGTYNLCPDIRFFATPPVDGSLANYVCHPADFCFKLPDGVSLDEGAMCEPLSVGVHACERSGVKPGSRVCVLGSGPIGMICMKVAKAYGASFVVMTDVTESRLAIAKSMGANAVVHVTADSDASAELVRKAAGGEVDVTIECCGFESAMRTAIHVTRAGGCVVAVGMRQADMRLPMMEAGIKELDIKGIFRYRHSYAKCISLLETKLVDVLPLVTHHYALSSQLLDAFETAKTGRDGAIKVMLDVE